MEFSGWSLLGNIFLDIKGDVKSSEQKSRSHWRWHECKETFFLRMSYLLHLAKFLIKLGCSNAEDIFF